MIVNSKRKNRIEEFIDEPHDLVEYEYDELLDSDLSLKEQKAILHELIERDPFYFDTYNTLAEIYYEERNRASGVNTLKKGYQKAIKRIVNNKGEFPKRMEWIWLENRHIIRIIDNWAYTLWEMGKTEEAIDLYRRLLKSNPNDNIGARYHILALRMGLDTDYDKQFLSHIPNYLDGHKISRWFETNSKKFPKEFNWWWKLMDERDGISGGD